MYLDDYSEPDEMVREAEQERADELREHIRRGGTLIDCRTLEQKEAWRVELRRQDAANLRRVQTYQLARFLEGDEETR